MKKIIIFGLSTALVTGCGAVGPRTGEIVNADNVVVASRAAPGDAARAVPKFALVEADRDVAFSLRNFSRTAESFFSDPGPARVTVDSGDVLQVSLVSVNDNGFVNFGTSTVSPVATTPFPPQVVSEMGTINVPPVGRVHVQGKTIPALEDHLEARLGEVLVNPSVVVDLVRRNSALVSVVGAVGSPGSFAYVNGKTRLRDIIGQAGGPSASIDGLRVSLTRSGDTRNVAMTRLLTDPSVNVHLRPGDIVSVEPRANSVVVLGASGSNERLLFDAEAITLSSVLGQIGGLENRRADPKGVFLYRPLPRTLATMLGIDTSQFREEQILTVFRFDLTEPTALFTVSEFAIENGDILYVSNSRREEIDSVLDLIADAVVRPVTIARTLEGN